MQPRQYDPEDRQDKVPPIVGQAQTQTKEQPNEPERSFKDKAIDTGLNVGIDALDGAGDVLGNAFLGGMGDMGIRGMQAVGQKLPFLKKIPGATRLAPFLMRDPRLAAIAGTGTAAYLGTNYLMDKSGAAEKAANLIVGNKDYSQAGNLTEEQSNLMEQGFNPYKPIKNKRGTIQGYERTPGYEAHIAAGGTQESYANRNADMNQPAPTDTPGSAAPGSATPAMDGIIKDGIGPFQPSAVNLGAVPQAQPQQAQPNLNAVQQAPTPGVPQYGDLVGSYKTSDGRNVGIFEGMPMRNKDGELTYITDEQVAAQQDRMDAAGTPVISGKKEGNLVPMIDNMGNVQFADQQTADGMNAIEAEYQKEDKAAHQRFLQSDAAARMTSRGLARAGAEQAAYDAASQAREGRLAARPDFMEPIRDSDRGQSKDGLSDAQRRDIFINPFDRARSKAGLNPDGSSMEDTREQAQAKIAETNARIAALKERDPSKYEANIEAVNGIMEGPQFKDLDPKAANRVRTLMLLQLSGLGTDETMMEFDEIVFPTEDKDPPSSEGSDSE